MRESNKTEAILSGEVYPVLIRFALPIIFGNIFQQLYNIVDAIVVGKFLGDLPLAGISAASPIMDVLYGLITGATVGIGALLGRLNGAGDRERLHRIHVTSLYSGGAVSLILTLLSFSGARFILRLQDTAPLVIDEAMKYLGVIAAGLILNFIYSYYASALRSCGDSRTPFIVLLVSSTLHAGLDVLFAGVFGWGVSGVAVSTVSCQLFSSLFLFFYAQRHSAVLAVSRHSAADRTELKNIGSYAFSGALQQIVIQLGRLLIQGMLSEMPLTGLNFAGEGAKTNMVTGYNMGMRTENFLINIMQGLSGAFAVCTAQNLGAGNIKRVKRFFGLTLATSLSYGVLIAMLCHFFAPQLIGIFSKNPQVIQAGALYTGTMAFVYLLPCLNDILQSFFRGIGKLGLCAAFSMGQVVLRVLLSALFIPRFGILGICYAVMIGWIVMALVEGPTALFTLKRLSALKAVPDKR